jgi:hypothetical protein
MYNCYTSSHLVGGIVVTTKKMRSKSHDDGEENMKFLSNGVILTKTTRRKHTPSL